MIQIRILNFPEEHHPLTIGTHLNQSLADCLGKFPQRVSSSHLRDYATAPSSGRLSAQSVWRHLFMQPHAPRDENQIISKSFLMAPPDR